MKFPAVSYGKRRYKEKEKQWERIMKAKKLAINGLFIALVFLATYLVHIPSGKGYINFGDTFIFLTVVLLGKKSGLLAGGIGSALADIALSYVSYAPFTLVIKGLEGLLAGLVLAAFPKQSRFGLPKILAFSAGAVFMVAGYYVAESFMYGSFLSTLANVPGNLIQGGASVAMAYVLSGILDSDKLKKYL